MLTRPSYKDHLAEQIVGNNSAASGDGSTTGSGGGEERTSQGGRNRGTASVHETKDQEEYEEVKEGVVGESSFLSVTPSDRKSVV